MTGIEDIKELIAAFDESSSVSLSLELEGVRLKLKKAKAAQGVVLREAVSPAAEQRSATPAAEPAAGQEAPEEEGELVKAPLVGVFYAAPSPDEPAYVQVGDRVERGQTLCLIEAMKMMNELKAPKSGRIKKIYVKNQDVVGYDDRLFLIGEE